MSGHTYHQILPSLSVDSWPTLGLNPLDPPVYTWKPKKNRRKEANEVASSSQPKK